MSYTVGTGTTVHAAPEGGYHATRCGAELAKGSALHKTSKAVTCKRCLSFVGVAHNGSVTPRIAAPVTKATKTITVKCGAVLEVLPHGKHLRAHNAKCRTCLGL